MVSTHAQALAYLKRALEWAKVDMDAIDVHTLPDILETYDKCFEPVTQEEANLIIEVIKLALIVKAEANR